MYGWGRWFQSVLWFGSVLAALSSDGSIIDGRCYREESKKLLSSHHARNLPKI